MPPRKKQKVKGADVLPLLPKHGPPQYELDGEPPPSKAERQAEWERVLGLRPGDLDRDRVERRDRAHQAYVRAQIDACYKVEK